MIGMSVRMQKNGEKQNVQTLSNWPGAVDSLIPRAYPYRYVSSRCRRHDVLLLRDAGVWIGPSEILPIPPGECGWVSFSSANH